MKTVFSVLFASALLLASSLAMPVDTDQAAPADNDVTAIAARFEPICESRYWDDLCINAKGADAYCDGGGTFRNKLEDKCKGHCWCE